MKTPLKHDVESHLDLENYLIQEFKDRLDIIKYSPQQILFLGSKSLGLLNFLQNKYPGAKIIQLDPDPIGRIQDSPLQNKILKNFFQKIFCPTKSSSQILQISGSFEQIPLAKNSVNMIISNLEIFDSDLKKSLPEISRVLNKNGLLMLSFPGPDTFLELRLAMASMDSQAHIGIFPDMHDLGDQLLAARFKDPVMDTEKISFNFLSIQDLFKFIKKNKKNIRKKALLDRPKFLYGKHKWSAWQNNYLKNPDGTYPVQFEINFAHAWGTDPIQSKDPDGYTRVSLEILKKTQPERIPCPK